jgi:hypothetical protein
MQENTSLEERLINAVKEVHGDHGFCFLALSYRMEVVSRQVV